MLDEKKRTWVEIKTSAFQYNIYKMMEKLPEGCKFMGVVKANAYGHGSVAVAKMLEKFRCDYLAVACLDEAEELRSAGITLPILILGATPVEFAARIVKADAAQALDSLDYAKGYAKELERLGEKMRVHVKLETGMGRTGFDVKNGDVSVVVKALAQPALIPEGVFTHCAVSDEAEGEEYTRRQYALFMSAIAKIEKEAGVHFELRHCANSGVMFNYPEMYLDMVRPGIALYGVYEGKGAENISMASTMELKSRIIQINTVEEGEKISYGGDFTADRKMKIAVVPVGYADGLHRVLSGKIEMLVKGQRCRQVGRICMDMCMLDVTDVEGVKVGDIATVFGHDGREIISVNDVAAKAGTIGYELLCSVSERVPRVYIG